MSGSVIAERQKVVSFTYQMNWSFEREKQGQAEFVDLIRASDMHFTAANFLHLDKHTILSVINTIIAFVIVLTQFHV